MRRVCAVVVLTIAGLIPLLRYHPSRSAPASTAVHASAPPQLGTAAPASPQGGSAVLPSTQPATTAPASPRIDTIAPAPPQPGSAALAPRKIGSAAPGPTQPDAAAAASPHIDTAAPVPPKVDTAIPALPKLGAVAPAPSGLPAPSRQKTVDGSTVVTEFGPYQVQVVFTGNKITDVQLITEPSDRHSQRIAANAAATLREEALQAQNARIDTVSGATTTSQAYAQSLQAAIDGKGS
jgi:uncharacterized protein with FMN-binding domain